MFSFAPHDFKRRSLGLSCSAALQSGEASRSDSEDRRYGAYNYTMANTYHQIYLQTVFAVKYRKAVIDKAWRNQLLGVMGTLINETKCKTIIVNGIEDHVHCFFGLKPIVSVSDLMKALKAKTSKYVNDHSLTRTRFEWQEGYGVFSYKQRDIDTIFKYILNQEEHHKKQTFRDEYVDLLLEFKVPYDERYIFKDLE
jgi:putative transposase